MRKAIYFLTVFALAGSLWAADPIIGTWKLNLEKSKGSQPSAAPKEQLEVYRELDSGEIELTLTRTMVDGTSSVSKLTWPAQGGTVTFVQSDPRGRSLVETLIAPGEWYVTYMREGKQYLTVHKVVSKDKKMLMQTFKGVFSGTPAEIVTVFDRQ
jgi:hypothetical protein